jgi:hypothetical protein
LIAGKAAGLFDDLAGRAAQGAVPTTVLVRPNAENRGVYEPMIEKYIQMQNSLVQFFR